MCLSFVTVMEEHEVRKQEGYVLCYQSREGSLPQKVTFEQRALGNEGQRHSGELGHVFQVKEIRAKALWSAALRLLEEQHGGWWAGAEWEAQGGWG